MFVYNYIKRGCGHYNIWRNVGNQLTYAKAEVYQKLRYWHIGTNKSFNDNFGRIFYNELSTGYH